MPFPANWLEELVIEWLDLEGFVISTSIFVAVPGGGRLSPDVVGAKLDENGRLLIRHCEAAMFLIDNPKKVADRYSKKFSRQIEQAVEARFGKIFSARVSGQVVYEKRVISFQASTAVQMALKEQIRGIQIHLLRDFVLESVLPAIKEWREPPNARWTTLPTDKWILDLIDRFQRYDLLTGRG